MNQDLSVSAFNPEFSFENMNLRLSTNESNTLLSWVNEKGTSPITLKEEIQGTALGVEVINHNIVLFTHKESQENPDHIYKIYVGEEGAFKLEPLYNGNLGFKLTHPLETLASYESDLVQKVYWTDGEKQPRVINIVGDIKEGIDTQFDFIPTLQLKESVKVEKQLGATGMFAPGVIQYAFTYYNKYGQESNIFYTTPLNYISYKERGASPEDKVENAFKITIENVDTNFEYLRIYSIQRTSIDATPICKRIQDIAITDNLEWVDENSHSKGKKASFTDTGTTGDSVDPTELLFKGGEVISAETMAQKDDTLFLGNIKVSRQLIESEERDNIKEAVTLKSDNRAFTPVPVSSGSYAYANQLTSSGGETRDKNTTVPCAGFKTSDWYRCGVQFQHESGKWSDPIWVRDEQITTIPSEGTGNDAGKISVPIISGELKIEKDSEGKYPLFEDLEKAGYKKIRPVVVFPSMMDRTVICQGVANPTMWTPKHRGDEGITSDGDLYAQSSWFFRPYEYDWELFLSTAEPPELVTSISDTTNIPISNFALHYTQRNVEINTPVSDPVSNLPAYDPKYIRKVEIEGDFDYSNKFRIDSKFRTLHSPDIEFDDQLQLLDFTGTRYQKVGAVTFKSTLSDIDIQTESPTISNRGSGFMHKAFFSEGPAGIISGLFYDDLIVDDFDDDASFHPYSASHASAKWLIYPWQSNGSLNNDINRPADKGNPTAVLKKKVISNLRYAETDIYQFNDTTNRTGNTFSISPQLFSSEEDTILKFSKKTETGSENMIYKGNIDTLLMPDNSDGKYFAWDSLEYDTKKHWFVYSDESTPFTSNAWCKFFSLDPDQSDWNGFRKWYGEDATGELTKLSWNYCNGHIGTSYVDLSIRKSPVRMKYKSTPHLVMIPETGYWYEKPYIKGSYPGDIDQLAIMEIQKDTDENTRFGGRSADAFRENKWLPCGIPVSLDAAIEEIIEEKEYKVLNFYYDYGDTYFQRYDCLKTYPFTREDVNQIVEIGSFMLETHVNIDGRYDRNRGQSNNLNMNPQNFNLMNPIYSQLDNFFTYRIQDDDTYKNNSYPNQITWSKTKSSNADIDMWNNVTLASTLELDGNKGQVTSLQRLNDQLICFQDSGISQILYNENTQISTKEGVPIEIANSGKVQGKRYLSNTIGCSNKWSIVTTPAGIYFMDSNEKSIYRLGEGLQNISQQGGFNTWCKLNIPSGDVKWTPDTFATFVGYYDRKNQDVLFINNSTALAFSEKVNAFTSFYDYGGAPFFCDLDDKDIWIKENKLWLHQAGEYCNFFGTEDAPNYKPYWMTLVGNPEPQLDKIFTNLEFRACVDGEGEEADGKYTPYLPFTTLETWNEYQHGLANLKNLRGHSAFMHDMEQGVASLKRKFRTWRCDIPRNNMSVSHKTDRMRNPWLYLKLSKVSDTSKRTEIHDVMMTYFI